MDYKNFWERNKKIVGKAIRSKEKLVKLDFNLIQEDFPELIEALKNNPQETLEHLSLTLEETGLIKDPFVIFTNLPQEFNLRIAEIRANNLNKIHSIQGEIIKTEPIEHRIIKVKLECCSCGTSTSLCPSEEINHKCSCGNNKKFNHLDKKYGSFMMVKLIDENHKDTLDIEFPERFLIGSWETDLKQGNKILVSGILTGKETKLNKLIFKLIPMELKVLETEKTFDIDKFSTPALERQRVLLVKEKIKEFENEYGKIIPLNKIRDSFDTLSDEEFNDAISKLKRSGDIFQPKEDSIQLV